VYPGWQQSNEVVPTPGEYLADLGLAWAYDEWGPVDVSQPYIDFMERNVPLWVWRIVLSNG
jgi:hypothetical protein